MMHPSFLAIPVFLASLAISAPFALDERVLVQREGDFAIGEVTGFVQMFSEDWTLAEQGRTTVRVQQGFPRRNPGAFDLEGLFVHPKAGEYSLKESFTRASDDSTILRVSLTSRNPVALRSLALALDLPASTFAGRTVSVDGKSILLPKDYLKGKTSIFSSEFEELVIPTPSGKIVLTGAKRLMVQDNREWKGDGFSVRLYFDPSEGRVESADLELKIRATGLDSRVVDLSGIANRAFADEVENDGKGGWTDQGKENDLRAMRPGPLLAAGLRFSVLDPSKGNSCVVFGGKGRESFPRKGEVPLSGAVARFFYLLHATAWTPRKGTPVGNLRFTFVDGSSESRTVTAGVDVGDWWNASDLTNGYVAWNRTNGSSHVGLYASRFPIPEKPLQSLAFEASGEAVWMVVAATLSTEAASFQTMQVSVYVAAGEEWAPVTDPRRIEAGSVLDFSFLQESSGIPAGRFGPVRVVGSHFEFARRPGAKVRFAGGNLCFGANYLSHEEADALTERLVRMGHNALRIHHYERDLMDKARPPGSHLVLEGQLDKLDYLVASAKKRGIYVTTDLFVSRSIRKGDVPGFDEVDMSAYKALVFFGPAREDFKKWAKWILVDHVNPYTGLPLGKDPVLATLSLVNEGNLTACWDASPATGALAKVLFGTWLRKNGLEEGEGNEGKKRFTRFLIETQIEGIRDLMAWVKDLGVAVPLTDCNMIDNAVHVPVRQELDFVDTHAYWDHPSFPEGAWRLPFRYHLRQVMSDLASMPSVQAGCRIFGKPFTISEYQYCFPNPYRAEGSLLMAAAAGLQDWDGLWRFALAHSRENVLEERPISGFDIFVDPVNLLGEQLVALSFLREDVRPAKGGVALVVDGDFLRRGEGVSTEGWSAFPKDFTQWAFRTRIGTFVSRSEPPVPDLSFALTPQILSPPVVAGLEVLPLLPDFIRTRGSQGLLPSGFDPMNGKVVSETGEIEIDGVARRFSLNAPRLQAVVLPEGGRGTSGSLSARSLGQYGIVAAASLDSLSISKSRRILVLHLTEINNAGMKYRNRSKNLVEEWGSSRRLVAKGLADVELSLDSPGEVRLYGCDLSGKRVEEIPLRKTDHGVGFLAETVREGKARFLVYELTRD